jgi:hypothetical protein
MTAELAQLADQLAPDYDAKQAMSDLQMMALMLQTDREELALTCANRVNAYLFKLDQAETERRQMPSQILNDCEKCTGTDWQRFTHRQRIAQYEKHNAYHTS